MDRKTNLKLLNLAKNGQLTPAKLKELLMITPEGVNPFWDEFEERFYMKIPIMTRDEFVYVSEWFNYLNNKPVYICIGKISDPMYRILDYESSYVLHFPEPVLIMDLVKQICPKPRIEKVL